MRIQHNKPMIIQRHGKAHACCATVVAIQNADEVTAAAGGYDVMAAWRHDMLYTRAATFAAAPEAFKITYVAGATGARRHKDCCSAQVLLFSRLPAGGGNPWSRGSAKCVSWQ